MKSNGLFKGVWSDGVRLWPAAFRRLWPWLVLAFLAGEAMEWVTASLTKLNDQLMLSGMLLTLAVVLLLMVITVILVNHVAEELRTGIRLGMVEALKRNFKYVFIESTRALKPITLKLLLLVVPGLIESVRLYFIPYVVQFDKAYGAGRIDALEESRELVVGRFWPITAVLLLSTVLSILPRFLLGQAGIERTPIYYVLAFFLSAGPELYGYLVMFFVYHRLVATKGKDENGNSVSLQRASKS